MMIQGSKIQDSIFNFNFNIITSQVYVTHRFAVYVNISLNSNSCFSSTLNHGIINQNDNHDS